MVSVEKAIVVWESGGKAQADNLRNGGSTITDLSDIGETPQIAMDSFGNAISVWKKSEMSRYIIQAKYYNKTSSSWDSLATTLSDITKTAFYPQIAMDSLGNGIAVWVLNNGTHNVIQARHFTKGVGWTPTTYTISEDMKNSTTPQIAMDSLGNGIAIWSGIVYGLNTIIQTNRYNKNNSSWDTFVTFISDGLYNSTFPQIAMDSVGNAMAVWDLNNGTTTVIQSSYYYKDTLSWTGYTLSSDTYNSLTPQISMNLSGNAIAVWKLTNTGVGRIQARYFLKGIGWSSDTETLSDITKNSLIPQVAIDSLGNSIVIWEQFNGLHLIIQASYYNKLNNNWALTTLSDTSKSSDSPQIEMDRSGNAIAVWKINVTVGITIIQASYYTKGVGWSSTPLNLSDELGTAFYPQLAIDNYVESTTTTTTTEPICLPAGTPILTDQGLVNIELIDPKKHTISHKRIVAVTKTITPEKHLICFEKYTLGLNTPTKRTMMTPGHEVLYRGKLVQAKHFLGRLNGIHTVPYNGEVLYNILQEKHGLMSVNNMVIETLHPENKVAKEILGKDK
jgi:microcompartment protein CcmK/EutM